MFGNPLNGGHKLFRANLSRWEHSGMFVLFIEPSIYQVTASVATVLILIKLPVT